VFRENARAIERINERKEGKERETETERERERERKYAQVRDGNRARERDCDTTFQATLDFRVFL